jgi:hypothetical protein
MNEIESTVRSLSSQLSAQENVGFSFTTTTFINVIQEGVEKFPF